MHALYQARMLASFESLPVRVTAVVGSVVGTCVVTAATKKIRLRAISNWSCSQIEGLLSEPVGKDYCPSKQYNCQQKGIIHLGMRRITSMRNSTFIRQINLEVPELRTYTPV